MDRYEDGKAVIKTNDLPGSDLPRDISIRDRQDRKQEQTSETYNFEKVRNQKLNQTHGGVI